MFIIIPCTERDKWQIIQKAAINKNPAKSCFVIKFFRKIEENDWWLSIWKLYAKLLYSVIRIQISSGSYIADQKGLPTGNEKILLPAGNNVRTHGNGSLLQIKRAVYTYILYTFRHIENQKV